MVGQIGVLRKSGLASLTEGPTAGTNSRSASVRDRGRRSPKTVDRKPRRLNRTLAVRTAVCMQIASHRLEGDPLLRRADELAPAGLAEAFLELPPTPPSHSVRTVRVACLKPDRQARLCLLIDEGLSLRSLRQPRLLRERPLRALRSRARLPSRSGHVGSLEPAGDGRGAARLARAEGRTYRLCDNYTRENVCNWAIPAGDSATLCRSCRLTRVIPDLSRPGAQGSLVSARGRQAAAGLHAPRLSPAGRRAAPRIPQRGLAFEFLADPDDPSAPRVLTGHNDGVITINVAEADDAEREQRRQDAPRAVPHAARPLPPRERSLLLGPAGRATASGSTRSARSSATSARTTREALAAPLRSKAPPADWQAALRQRLRQRAPVGRLGRDLGALPAHDRHARDGSRVRAVAPAAPRRRAVARDAPRTGARSRPFDQMIEAGSR